MTCLHLNMANEGREEGLNLRHFASLIRVLYFSNLSLSYPTSKPPTHAELVMVMKGVDRAGGFGAGVDTSSNLSDNSW